MNQQLNDQLKELKPGNPILIVGDFLKGEFEKDIQLSEDFTNNAIKMDELWAYIVDEARKKAENGSCCMADAEVFGLAIHYIHDGYKEALEKKKIQAREKAKAVSKSSDDEDGSSYPTIEELQEQAAKRLAESKAKKDEERRKKALEKQEAKRKASGQLSIFDFMNEA